jgi:hypothetical protein
MIWGFDIILCLNCLHIGRWTDLGKTYTSLLIPYWIWILKVLGSVHQLSTSGFIFSLSINISHFWQVLMGLFVAGNWSSCDPHLMHQIYSPTVTTPFTVYIVMLMCRWFRSTYRELSPGSEVLFLNSDLTWDMFSSFAHILLNTVIVLSIFFFASPANRNLQ